ncbi:MAG: efflux RND transporter permease subunit, partial [Candidatus Hydrogenedentes bacterium]|nr:efflux RND transporter permease subunit [Candidatus Hydrogenedentota bacterium]
DGIVDVSAFGGKEFAVEVIVDEDKCEAFGVPLSEIGRTIAAFNRRTEYLGDITELGVRYFVSLTGRFSSIVSLRELPVGPTGQVRLKDVAEVRFGHKDADRISRIDGEHAVMLLLRKDDLANMLRVAKNVYREIDRLNIELAERGVQIKTVMDTAEMVADSIHRVERLALTGVALAVGVLLIFLKRLRTVSIILVAIPVSLLITFNLMYYMELSINLLSLVGFALAIGLLVDNGVVVIENTFRCAARAKDGIEAAIQGTKEVSMPIVAMTGTTLIAFLPVFFLENESRIILEEFVYSIGSPLIVSVFVSLTLVPMLAARTIDLRVATERKHSRFLEMYVAILKAVLRRRAFSMVMTIVLFFFTLIVCLPVVLSLSAFPEPLDRVEYEIHFPRGTTIETASRLTAKLEDIGREFQDVKMVHSAIEPELAQVTIEFLDPEDRTVELDIGAIRREIEKRVETIEGLGPDRVWPAQGGGSYGGDKNETSMEVLGGFAQEHIEVRGEDPETLERIAFEIEQRLSREFENYMSTPRTAIQPGGPELEIRGQRSLLARWGLTMADMTSVVWLTRARGDELVVPFRTQDQDVDIVVRLKEAKERTFSDLEGMRLRTPDGRYLDLAEVAEFKVVETSKQIVRLDRQHEIRVHYAFRQDVARSPARLEALQAQVDDVIGSMKFPEGYTLKIVHKEETDYSMLWAMIAAVVCVFLLLAALFEDLSTPLCVMATLPLAVIGVLWGLVFTQTGLGNPTVAAGVLMLVGIVVNDAILTLGQARLLLKKGYTRTRAVLEGGRNRLRPIMMTTSTTVLAMLPLAIRAGGENEIWPPFAITVIFGLIASTFFTLVFIPAMYLSLEDIDRWLNLDPPPLLRRTT